MSVYRNGHTCAKQARELSMRGIMTTIEDSIRRATTKGDVETVCSVPNSLYTYVCTALSQRGFAVRLSAFNDEYMIINWSDA